MRLRQLRPTAGEIPHHHRRPMSRVISAAKAAVKAKVAEEAVPEVVVVAEVEAEVVGVGVVAEVAAGVNAMPCERPLLILRTLSTARPLHQL